MPQRSFPPPTTSPPPPSFSTLGSSAAQERGSHGGWGRLVRVLVPAATGAAVLISIAAPAAYADSQSVVTIIDNVRNWIAGLLAALATLFMTYGGLRYLTAAGNPRAVEEAKSAIRSALIGYALAGLAPILVATLRQVVGV